MTSRITGQEFDQDEEKILADMAEHWRKVGNETAIQAITRLEDASKQIIVITSGLQGLYLAIFSLSTIRNQIALLLGSWLSVLLVGLFLLPVLCWLISLVYTTRVFVPRAHLDINLNEVSVEGWQKVKKAYGRVGEQNLRWLHRSHTWLIISFVFIILCGWIATVAPCSCTRANSYHHCDPYTSSHSNPFPLRGKEQQFEKKECIRVSLFTKNRAGSACFENAAGAMICAIAGNEGDLKGPGEHARLGQGGCRWSV